VEGWTCAAEIVQLLAEKRSAVEVPGASLLPAHESEAMGDDATEEAAAEPEVTAVSPLEAEMEEQGELAEKRSAVVVPGASLLPAHEKEEEAESEAMGDDPTEEAAAEPEVTAVSPLEAEMEEQGEQQGAPQQQEVMLVVSNPDTAQEVQEEVVSLQPPNDWPVQPSQAVEAMDTLGASGVSNWPLALPSPTVLAEAAAAAAAATTAAAGLDRADSMKLMSDTMELSDSPLVTASTPTTSRKWYEAALKSLAPHPRCRRATARRSTSRPSMWRGVLLHRLTRLRTPNRAAHDVRTAVGWGRGYALVFQAPARQRRFDVHPARVGESEEHVSRAAGAPLAVHRCAAFCPRALRVEQLSDCCTRSNSAQVVEGEDAAYFSQAEQA
jgi:hypothetical protein